MADVKPRDYVIAIIVFIMIASGITFMIDSIAVTDPGFITAEYDNFNDSVQKRADITEKITSLRDKIGQDEAPSILDSVSLFFLKGFNILASLFSSLSFMESTITTLGTLFSAYIPSFFPELLITLIVAFLMFAIVSAILQRDI